MSVKLLTEHHLQRLSLKVVYTCQNATLLEITSHGLYFLQASLSSSYIQQVSDEAMRFREFILQLVINNFVQVKDMAVHPLHPMVSCLVYSNQPTSCWLWKGVTARVTCCYY